MELRLTLFTHIHLKPGDDTWSLSEEIEEWLEERNIVYNFNYSYVQRPGGSVFINFYIDFEDPNDAIMFKIVWGARTIAS
jgi:hypothetical protein